MERLTEKELYMGDVTFRCGQYEKDCDGNCQDKSCGLLREAVRRIKEYEDLEEQGKLLKMPCAVGDTAYTNLQSLLREAANTIESLSAKLADMARPAGDCGGWIPCKDRVPTNEECKVEHEFNVTVNANGLKTLTMDFEYETVRGKEVCRWKWLGRLSPWKVIAWRKKPEPYHEP